MPAIMLGEARWFRLKWQQRDGCVKTWEEVATKVIILILGGSILTMREAQIGTAGSRW
jgi:hypothetical protein